MSVVAVMGLAVLWFATLAVSFTYGVNLGRILGRADTVLDQQEEQEQ